MALDLSSLVPIYQENIDALINQLGKPVTLYFEKAITNVTDDFRDPVRDDSIRLPDFKATTENPKPTVSVKTRTIKALVQIAPREFYTGGISRAQQPGSIIRIKTFLTDVPDLKRCDYIVPMSDDTAFYDGRYRMIREPIPIGLQVNRYAVSFWEKL